MDNKIKDERDGYKKSLDIIREILNRFEPFGDYHKSEYKLALHEIGKILEEKNL